MFCPNDGIENREGAKRCKKCGACLNCGEKDPGEKICRKCRIPLSDTGLRQCPKGHTLPQGSDRCDICEGNSGRPLAHGSPVGGARRRQPGVYVPPELTQMDDEDSIPTNIPEPRPDERRRQPTRFGSAGSTAKIVGVLVTYSWKREGEIFEIREGRNLIGSDLDCDVRLDCDPALSGKHAHITFLKSFVIGDMVSKSGTFVDDQPIESERLPLRNGATIRTGGTVWTFVSMPSPGEHSEGASKA